MNKTIFGIMCGLVGAAIGAVATKLYYERTFDDVVNDIYNQCYADAKAELEGANPVQENTVAEDHKEMVKIVKQYKPNLNEIAVEEIPEDDEDSAEEDIEIDQDYMPDIGTGFITEEQFDEGCAEFSSDTIYFYDQDCVFTSTSDEVIETHMLTLFKEQFIQRFKQAEIVYFRDAELEINYCIEKMPMAYSDAQYETPHERFKRLNRKIEKKAVAEEE